MNSDQFATRAIHVGQAPDAATGAVVVPIYQTSTYAQSDVGEHKGYDYSRTANPTRAALEECLASLEEGKFGLAFSSGMGAITTLMFLLKKGDHVVVCDDVYGGTFRLFRRVLEDFGLEFSFVDMTNPEATARAVRVNTRMLWIETPTNPLIKVVDIAAIAQIAKKAGAWTVVDNTFVSPYLQKPLTLGADIVMHSTTKYLGGHSDVIGGAVVTADKEIFERLKFLQNAAGAVPGPLDCWLVLRGIKTLALRMERHSENALTIAQMLEKNFAVERVFYPGLKSHPQYEIARRQMGASGGMLSFIARGGAESARRIARATRLFTLGESLGGVESLIEVPAAMTHMSVAGSPLEVSPALVRLSVGIEHADDLRADLEQAFAQS
ncbi:MAG: cystathionine gamma-synthase [Chloroflexi bacterium]|nr:cystathionine gamma-synthase [Chloroflexota bacterium]